MRCGREIFFFFFFIFFFFFFLWRGSWVDLLGRQVGRARMFTRYSIRYKPRCRGWRRGCDGDRIGMKTEGDKICKKGQSSRKRLHGRKEEEEKKEGKKAPGVRIGVLLSHLL